MKSFEFEADQHEFKNKVSSLNSADRQRGESSQESRKILKDYYDKILFYSAGAFSFLVALLQIVPNKHVLSSVGILGIPNVFLMYTSMTCYIISGVLVLLSRRFDAYYISFNSLENYCKKLLEERESKLVIFQKYPETVEVHGGVENQILSIKSDIKLVREMLPKNVKGNKLWYNLMKWTGYTTEFFAIIATIIMLLFTVQLSQSLVW